MKYKTLKDNNLILPHILLGLRGCLLALFCSLFVLTACGGGGGAATTTTGSAADNCPIDPFGATCGNEYAAARAQKINECLIDDMATEDPSCASAANSQSCLKDPFAAGCDEDKEFSAFLEVAKDQREAFCNIDDNAKDTLCAGAVSTVCGDNPFNGLCKAASYIRQQGEIVADCITEGKASESTCANAVDFNPCIGNPFTPECVTQTDARTMREAFCRKDDNATNALCAGALAHFCELDPFDAICDATAYSRQQMERVDFCISDDNASNNTLCANAVAQDACIRDPFTVTCITQDVYRSIRESFCRQGTNAADYPALCGNAVVNICTNDPFDGLCNPDTYIVQRNARTIECEDEEPTNSRCTNVLLFLSKMTCMDDPFGKGCEGETESRMTRQNLCRDNDNRLGLANDSQCTGALAHFCGLDPFDGLCNPTTYSDERMMRVAECIMDDNASDDDLCANAILANNCISNPYGTNCGSETAARTARESFCRGDPRNPSNPLCTGAVTHFCATSPTANPFDADLCMTYGSTRDGIIRSCITADDTRWRQGACTNAVAANPCIETPFDRNCVTDFADYYQDARAKRTTFCVGQENTYDLCAGAVATNLCFKNPFVRDLDNNGAEDCSSEFAARREEQINKCIVGEVGQTVGCINVLAGIGGCLANPFHSSCHAEVDTNSNPNTYFKDYADAARAARVDFCDMDDGAIRDHDYCFGRTFNHDICVYDPYSSFCKDESFNAALSTTVEAQRTQKVVFCGRNNNEDHGSCTHVRDLVTAATWAHGLGSALNTQPTAGTNEFLRANDLDNANELDKGSTGATGTNLNLATSTFDYNAFGDTVFGGDATDGVEFFAGSGNYYAGIFGGADLGKPLSGATRTVYWNGRISSTISTGNTNSDGSTTIDADGVIVATDFTLTIEFNGSGGTLESFAKVFLDETANNHYYDIEGTFNEHGLITGGTVVYAVFTDGDEDSRVADSITDATLSGIIGKEGALGVFQGAHFSGGFVAHPTIKARVEISDWVRGFGSAPPATAPTAGNGFLQEDNGVLTVAPTKITAGGTDTTAFEFVTLNTVTESVNGVTLPIVVNDVSWFSGYYTNSIQYHYATVSDTAYLGEPLSEAPTSSIWYGKFGAGANKTDFALTITYSTSERKISAFVRESVGVYYLLAGDFNSAGVITNGTVNYGAFANGVRTAPVASRATNGRLTGLIGKDGVLGAFHSTATGATGYAGGFWAAPVDVADDEVSPFTAIVDYDDYRRSFLSLADNPDTDTPQNQFLTTTSSEYPPTGTISTTGTTATQAGGENSIVYSLDLNAINLDGADLGLLNTTSRVDWFSGYIGGTQYHYAGVVRANLGAPLTTTPAGGEWRGVIFVSESRTDFTLTITYETAGGTLSAFVRDTPNDYYLLDGGFDANGLIDGTVRYGTFTDNDRNNIDDVAPSGVLTGLIGTDGALGVFHSTATGAAGYSGGFVALPGAPTYDTDVKYSDYRRSFLSLGAPDTTNPKNQFVTVETTPQGLTDITSASIRLSHDKTLDGLPLKMNTPFNTAVDWYNGIAGSSSTRTYYAGLSAGIDLGAPITTSGEWHGVFGVGATRTHFTLEITYGTDGGTIAAFIRELEDSYYLLAGDFDANGLITGTVNYGVFTDGDRGRGRATDNGTLTGLIGVEGAFGAFYSDNDHPTARYSGGFFATDELADYDASTVRYLTWAQSFLSADTPDKTNPRNQFLRAKADGELSQVERGSTPLKLVNLNEAKFNDLPIDGDINDRYDAFNRLVSGDWYIYAGILPSTDLGAPVEQNLNTELTWYGNFTSGQADRTIISEMDFVLNITLNGTGGTLEARANYRNKEYFYLEGDFDANGLITGTVAYNVNSFDDTANGILTGIIGQEGAIGVFYGTRGAHDHYGGGFVASPKTDTFTDSVKYSDWFARENPNEHPSIGNKFLQTSNKEINATQLGGGTFTHRRAFTLNLNTAEFDGAPILGDADVGFIGFEGTVNSGTGSASNHVYIGIFDSTNLGAPLTSTEQMIEWNGVFRYNTIERSATFKITFTPTGGKIDAFLPNLGSPTLDFLIAGTFDDLGLITGTINYAQYANDDPEGTVSNGGTPGILSGLIGAEGAVGVFHSIHNPNPNAFRYAVGFVASPYVKLQANWNDWQDSFGTAGAVNLDSTPNTGTLENQFLYGDAGILSDININHTSSITTTGVTIGLNDGTFMDEATYGGEPLGGNGTGGIIYWHGFQGSDDQRLYYAQIYTDTKLGAVIEETIGTATYTGQFRAFTGGPVGGGGIHTDTDFTLEVNFVGSSIAAFVKQDKGDPTDTLYYLLSGNYTANGVISGDVIFDRYSNHNRLTPANTAQREGKLTGLISKDNALGVFVSGNTLAARGAVTGAESRGATGFVGGFVARRTPYTNVEVDDNDNRVTYNDWNRIINPVATPSFTRSQFLQPNGRTISEGGLTPDFSQKTLDFATAQYDGTPAIRDGDASDGFAYFSYSNGPALASYSGIFQTTNLGGLLLQESDPTLTWNGQLNFRETTHDFTLNIEFSGGESGTINGFVENVNNTARDFLLEGDFDVSGVITGTTNYAEFTGSVATGAVTGTSLPGILSGLIGQDGAVAVFNAINSSHSYAGGFVAHEDIAIRVDYGDWLRGVTYATARTDGNKFLQPTEQSFASITDSTVFSLDLNDNFEGVSLEGNSDDGFVSFIDSSYAYAGIYQTTDLGAPLRGVSDTFVRWLGLVQFNELTIESNFRVGFDNTGAGGTIWAINANISDHADFLIDGDFDANGVITGKTHYARFVRDAAPARNAQSGTLRGIIGQEGAVGVFYGPSGFQNFNYSGGFVARPTLLVTGDGVVKYTDWLRRTITDASPDTTTFVRSQFLRTNGTNISASGVTRQGSFNRLSLARTRDDGLILGGAASNGVIYFNTSGNTGYAGIYSSTNLGAPLAPNSPGMTWQGVFGIAVGSANYTDDFTLTIAPNATGGTISGTAHVSGLGSDVTITGNFDERGVIYSGFVNSRPLSGLIGAEGAVGAFIGANDAGGFVAHKTTRHDGVVKYNDWRRETETFAVPATSPARSQFLETSGITINNGDASLLSGIKRLTLSERRIGENVRLNTAGGSHNDGFAYFTGSVTVQLTGFNITRNLGYAGIYQSTNLGAPLRAFNGSASWKGIFAIVGSNNTEYRHDFNLSVTSTGSGGSIRGEVNNNARHSNIRISAWFDANGVMNAAISGNGLGPTTISGLIGQEGAVGVFYADTASIVGGFVAAPTPSSSAPAQPRFGSVLPANADYTAWRDSFTSAPANLDTANRRNQLLASTSNNGISDEGNTGRKPILIESLNLSTAEFNNKALGGNAGDGVALFKDYPRDDLANSPFYNYATILSTTDLGLPLPYKANYNGDATAMWKGAATFGDGNFTLEVNFAQSKVEAFHPDSFSKYYHLKGDYDVHGVISGTTAYGRFNTSTRAAIGTTVPGILTGLIGSNGAVGVIIGGTSSDGGVTITGGTGADGYVGGFVACPLHADGRCMSATR